jgi:K+/H+ antiporter YhaU regulatory subunit KhtT
MVPPKYLSVIGTHVSPPSTDLKTPPPTVPIQYSWGRATLPAAAAAVGQPISSLVLSGCNLSALVRGGQRRLSWPPELTLEPGDTLVLVGTLDQVNAAEARLTSR